MSADNTTKPTADPVNHDWTRFDAMTDAQRHDAAISDPDAQPLTPEDARRMKRTPQVKIIRRALGLSQEDFSARFHIPLGTLRDWEQARKEWTDAHREKYEKFLIDTLSFPDTPPEEPPAEEQSVSAAANMLAKLPHRTGG